MDRLRSTRVVEIGLRAETAVVEIADVAVAPVAAGVDADAAVVLAVVVEVADVTAAVGTAGEGTKADSPEIAADFQP
jgi:hypothetical protein